MRSHALVNSIATGVAVVLLVGGVFLFYRARWGSVDGFVRRIDHGHFLFLDFVMHYYPAGREVLQGDLPVPGFYYSPISAVLFFPIAQLPLLSAEVVWGVAQIASLVALFALSGLRLGLSRGQWIGYLAIYLTSVPVLNNFKWGHVSVLVVLGAWIAFDWILREKPIWGGGLLALVSLVKYYPVFLAVVLFHRRDLRALFSFLLGLVVLGVVVPAAVLGPVRFITFQEESFRRILELSRSLTDPNSQSAIQVAARALDFSRHSAVATAVRLASLGIAILNLALAWKVSGQRTRRGYGVALAFLFLSTPFLVETTWPHYFVFLPFCQVVAAKETMAEAREGRRVLGISLVAATVVMASAFVFELVASYYRYGVLFAADVLLLSVLYASHLIPGIRSVLDKAKGLSFRSPWRQGRGGSSGTSEKVNEISSKGLPQRGAARRLAAVATGRVRMC